MIGQQTFVANASVRTSSDSAFGTLTAAASIGQLIGPPLVNVAASLVVVGGQDEPNTAVGLAICTTMLVLGTPTYLALRRLDRSLGDARCSGDLPPPGTGALLKTPQMGRSLAVSGVVLVSLNLMYAFVPVWATERGINATAVGLLLALRAAVTVASRVGLARLVARFGRKTLITVSIGAAIAGLTALPFVGLWGGVLVVTALGIGLGVPQPLTMAWVTSLTPPQSHGATLGSRLTSNRLAQIVVPVAVGALAAPFGVLGIFWANAALLVGAAGIMVGSQPMDEGHSR